MELRGCTTDKADNYKRAELTDGDARSVGRVMRSSSSLIQMIRKLMLFPITIGVFLRSGHSGL
jgi:hypothetical protein